MRTIAFSGLVLFFFGMLLIGCSKDQPAVAPGDLPTAGSDGAEGGGNDGDSDDAGPSLARLTIQAFAISDSDCKTGTITSVPAGINCEVNSCTQTVSGTCAADFTPGTSLELSGTDSAGIAYYDVT